MSEPTISVDLAANKLCAVLGRLEMALDLMRSNEHHDWCVAHNDVIEARAAALELAEACREARRAFRAAEST